MRWKRVALAAFAIALGPGVHARAPDAGCRAGEPVEAVIRDVHGYARARIAGSTAPGLSLALVRNGRVVWASGYGRTNSLFPQPVEAETVFPVASLGKPVTAYGALRLVEQGRLRLDTPLAMQLRHRWLPATPEHDAITLGQLLSHRSGLGNVLRSSGRRLAFAPGTGFDYSGIGYMYVQDAIRQAGGAPFEETMRRLVFAPLGMRHSSFTSARSPLPAAVGHNRLEVPVVIFSIFFGIAAAVLLLPFLGVNRLIMKRWRPGRRALLLYVAAATAAAAVAMVVMAGRIMGLYFTASGLALLFLVGLLYLLFARLLPARRAGIGQASAAGAALAVVAGLVLALRTSQVPVPDWNDGAGNAASSLRSTAPDLARFVAAMLNDSAGRPGSAADRTVAPVVEVGDRWGWGLGFGTFDLGRGSVIWHRGSTPAYQAVLAACVAERSGVVVLSNSGEGENVVKDVAARALGGIRPWDMGD